MLGVCSLIGTTSLPPPAAPAVKSRLRTPLPRGPTELGQSCFVCGAVLWLPLLLTGAPSPPKWAEEGAAGTPMRCQAGSLDALPTSQAVPGARGCPAPTGAPVLHRAGLGTSTGCKPSREPFFGREQPLSPLSPLLCPQAALGCAPHVGCPARGHSSAPGCPRAGECRPRAAPPGRDRVHSSRCFPPRAHPLTAFCWPENGVRLQGAADALGLLLRPAPCTLHPAPCRQPPGPQGSARLLPCWQ